MTLPDAVLAVANIPVGDHIKRGGLDVDTIYTTVFAAAVVLGLGFLMRARVSAGVPSKVQVFWETIVGAVGDQVEAALGPKYRRVVPLGVAIFTLVLAADWVEVLPGLYHNTDFAPSPSADVNLCYALGILVFILTNAAGIRARGFGGYVKHYFRKPIFLFPLNVIEELVKPLTLALRLFGNIFAGGIMIALILAFPIKFSGLGIGYGVVSVVLTVIWKVFDMFIGVIQAFIFALLTILYFQFATEEAH
jgi:F-type H+-transporting ATPase subunit a